ncbi:MAG: hypothetical protein OJJ55_06625 [Rhodococcus sp.]|nr:hypothetical protein [Rhodococcus sp. (in: high G+C Gram-positive bacteria)]
MSGESFDLWAGDYDVRVGRFDLGDINAVLQTNRAFGKEVGYSCSRSAGAPQVDVYRLYPERMFA